MTESAAVRRRWIPEESGVVTPPSVTKSRDPGEAVRLRGHSPDVVAYVQQMAAVDPEVGRQRAIEAVRARFAGPYDVGGDPVSAPPMFRMNGGYNHGKMKAHTSELTTICQKAKLPPGAAAAAMMGRPTPEGLVKVTQALIDAGKLPPPPGHAATRIRQMQWEWGIGVDCAGYTAQAAVAVHGVKASSLLDNRTDPFATMVVDRARFDRVGIEAMRAGDIIHLNAPAPGDVGHNVLVHSSSELDAGTRGSLEHRSPAAAQFLRGKGPFHVVEVDSSWGADAGKEYGGYRRDTWIFDADSKKWGYFTPVVTPAAFLVSERGPNNEPFAGAFRPKGAR
jgi:hypothetical protein